MNGEKTKKNRLITVKNECEKLKNYIKFAYERHAMQSKEFVYELEQIERMNTKTTDDTNNNVNMNTNTNTKEDYEEEDLVSPRSRKLLRIERNDRDGRGRSSNKYEDNELNEPKLKRSSSPSSSFVYLARTVVLVLSWNHTQRRQVRAMTDFESLMEISVVYSLFVLVSDSIMNKNMIESALDVARVFLLRVFALALGTISWFVISVLFSQSVLKEKKMDTIAFAFFMSSLTVLPGTNASAAKALVQTKKSIKFFTTFLRVFAFVKLVQRTFVRIFIERRFRSEYDAFFRATVLMVVLFAWIGGLLAPLDWQQTSWHKFPNLSARLAIYAHALGTLLTALFSWLDRIISKTKQL